SHASNGSFAHCGISLCTCSVNETFTPALLSPVQCERCSLASAPPHHVRSHIHSVVIPGRMPLPGAECRLKTLPEPRMPAAVSLPLCAATAHRPLQLL